MPSKSSFLSNSFKHTIHLHPCSQQSVPSSLPGFLQLPPLGASAVESPPWRVSQGDPWIPQTTASSWSRDCHPNSSGQSEQTVRRKLTRTAGPTSPTLDKARTGQGWAAVAEGTVGHWFCPACLPHLVMGTHAAVRISIWITAAIECTQNCDFMGGWAKWEAEMCREECLLKQNYFQ